MHEVRASSLLGLKAVHQHPSMSSEVETSKPGGLTLGSTIRSPLTGSDADHAAVQASGIEKSVVDVDQNSIRSKGKQPLIGNIQHLFVQEGPRVPSAIHRFTNSGSRRSFRGAMFASTGSHCNSVDFTVPEINRIVLLPILLVCTLFNHTPDRSIQQSNRQVPMKQFVMFQRLLFSLCQSVSAPS
jgi:hypothetical protein